MQTIRHPKVVRTDQEIECETLDRSLREFGVKLLLLPESVTENELIEEIRDTDLLLMCYTRISANIIDAASKLKGIVKYGVGIDAIDIDAAKARQIPVVNIPEYAEETVAEGAFAMLIALAKKTIPIRQAMEAEGWVWPIKQWLGSDISGKTLGVVGVGRIGRSMARMAGAGFNARVLGFDPGVDSETMRQAGLEKRDRLRDMLAECDFVSLHCVLNENTRGIFGESEFQAMKPSALFINTSRGALVDEDALLDAVTTKKIAGAGLDTFTHEPLNRSNHPLHELYGRDNVILMPHLTFYSQEAMQRLEQETFERCVEVLTEQPVLIKSGDPRLTTQRHGVRLKKR